VEITRATQSKDLLILKLAGKFDLEKTLQECTAEKPVRVGVDLVDVNFIDSSGMGALIKGLNAIKAYGGEMTLIGLKPNLLNVFRLARLDSFFKIAAPEEFQA
jgi:anti-sigma B factor antagonist